MQHVAATVRLGGDLNFAIRKPNLTVPEVVLLRLLHGSDAVVEVRPIGVSPRTLRAERDRLMAQYGQKPDYVKKIDGMFANIAVQPLESLADIGIDPSTPAEPKLQKAVVIKAEDLRPYDATDDIVPGPDPEAEPDELVAAPPEEILDDFVPTAPTLPSAEEAAKLIEAGAAAARKRK